MLIDVSQEIKPGSVFRLGTPPVEITSREFFHESEGTYKSTMLSLSAHTATHIDLVYMEKHVSLERMIGRGKLIDVTEIIGREIQITDIENQVEIESGDFVFFRTDWSTFLGTEKYHAHPEISKAVVDLLVLKKINMVGIDALGLGQDRKHGEHDRFLAQNDIFIIENLTNLSAIPTQEFRVYCFPLKFKSTDAIPARVVIETDN